jgi:hypothetical protein
LYSFEKIKAAQRTPLVCKYCKAWQNLTFVGIRHSLQQFR